MNLENLNLTFSLEYIVIIMAIIILYLLYYVFTKDAKYTKNIRSVASVVEDVNREIYYLKKKLEQTQQNIQNSSPQHMSDDEIYQEIERSVYDMQQPLALALKQMQNNIESIELEIDSRISQLESGVKQISIPSSLHANDDDKIISLYKQGVDIEVISKELHLAQPEVEFVLKINKIR